MFKFFKRLFLKPLETQAIPIGDFQFNDVIVISPLSPFSTTQAERLNKHLTLHLKDPCSESVLFVPENCQILGIIRRDITTGWVDKFIEWKLMNRY